MSLKKADTVKQALTLIGILLFLVSCQKSMTDQEIEQYRQQGNEIVKNAGHTLSSTLTEKMKEGGIEKAIGFCNQSALPITRKVSSSHGVEIKRTSLKLRNPENAPDEDEIQILKEFERQKAEGQEVVAVVNLDSNGTPRYYEPIFIEKKCLMCHGQRDTELSRAVDSLIKSKYPGDLATGYRENDLRGMWSIAFSTAEP